MRTINFSPAYVQIGDMIKERIIEGSYPDGHVLPAEDELAAEFGVSKPTLRKALNILKEQRYINKQNGIGTFVTYSQGKPVKAKRVGVSGILLKHSYENYHSELFAGISDELETDKSTEIIFLPSTQQDYDLLIKENNLDALIIASPANSNVKKIISSSLKAIPHVIVGSANNEFIKNKLLCIDTDNVQGAYDMVNYLLSQGHQHIAFVGGRPDLKNSADRELGYRKALQDHKLPVDEAQIISIKDKYVESSYTAATELLKQEKRPTAIFACGMELVIGAHKAISELGLTVPDDISLAGFDDFNFSQMMTPPLTTVKQPVYELGKLAGNLIIDQLRQEKVDKKETILKTELIIRDSIQHI